MDATICCARCGHHNPQRAKFCAACGLNLAAAALPLNEHLRRTSRKTTNWTLLALALAALVIGAIFAGRRSCPVRRLIAPHAESSHVAPPPAGLVGLSC